MGNKIRVGVIAGGIIVGLQGLFSRVLARTPKADEES